MKILIADDHPIIRTGIKKILGESSCGFEIDEASSGEEILEKFSRNRYELVLLDISLPDMNGLDVLKIIKTQKPSIPVLVLSVHPVEQYAIRALRAGASGYITKASATQELMRAIEKVAQGGKYITPAVSEKLLEQLDQSSPDPIHSNLSDRELEIMLQIASGKKLKEIAESLCISRKTVSTYRARIMRKMNVKSNAELTCYVMAQGLMD